ncbi:MAG: glucokinase [Parvularculaceae bacterium]|nr:glucokinase [Parvularculaceae bacterium]
MKGQLLVADIGGTNARFALADAGSGAISSVQALKADDYPSVEAAALAYLGRVGVRSRRACFAVAAPVGAGVDSDVVAFVNSDWRFEISSLKRALGLDQLIVVNDFFALASGVAHLPADFLVPVKDGRGVRDAPVVVIGPGTGLGQALIVPCGGARRVVATEGGHVGFAARTTEEFEIVQQIARKFGRVSAERIVSGPGLENLYAALCAQSAAHEDNMSAEQITAAAIAQTDPVAVKTVELFCRFLGRIAGDAVLSSGARGGVVLGGGIAPKIRESLLAGGFVDGFIDKGRMRAFVEPVPVSMIVKPGAALIGAASVLREQE